MHGIWQDLGLIASAVTTIFMLSLKRKSLDAIVEAARKPELS